MFKQDLKIPGFIFKYLQGTITAEEERALNFWLQTSERHRLLFQKLISVEGLVKKRAVYRRFDRYYNFEIVRKKIRVRKYSLLKERLAAAVIVLLVSAGTVLYFRTDFSETENTIQASVLSPGKVAAVLILSDGQMKMLDENFPVLSDGKQQIINKDGRVVYPETKAENTDTVEMYHEIKVPRGGEYKVTLSDGTRIWLNSESSVCYPIAFKKEERRIRISGEVFLEVAKDSLHPFIVSSQHLKVRVLGTKFNMRDYQIEKNAAATLVEGKVEVAGICGKTAVLKPSEQCIYDQTKGSAEVIEVDTELFVSWKDGIYQFKSQRLEDILNVISRWYDVEVYYQNPEVKDIMFSGRLKRYDNAQSLLEAFEKVGGVKFSIEEKNVIVKAE